MSPLKSRLLKRLGVGTAALLGLGAVALQSTPADARVFLSFGAPGYYGYGYAPYYPAYSYGYGYPYYGYPYGFGFGGHHHHWR